MTWKNFTSLKDGDLTRTIGVTKETMMVKDSEGDERPMMMIWGFQWIISEHDLRLSTPCTLHVSSPLNSWMDVAFGGLKCSFHSTIAPKQIELSIFKMV